VPASEVSVARALVERLGGRFSVEMGIWVERGPREVDRWFLASTLFGTRISWPIVERTFAVLMAAGVRTIADAGRRTWDELVPLLDAGGYARYDERTATRLLELARAVRERHGRISTLAAERDAAAIEAALDALPGWGPTTVRLFLRELRGVWPAADPPLDERTAEAAAELGVRVRDGASLGRLARRAGVDPRDLETALVRSRLSRGRGDRAH
jgi:hypothetical protein